MDHELLKRHGLERLADVLTCCERPAVAFWPSELPKLRSRSRFGGEPLLPPDFSWPESGDRPLDFLLQIDMADVKPFDPDDVLPPSGLLTIFYDTEEQPWGYDPDQIDGFCVELITRSDVVRTALPEACARFPQRFVRFGNARTLPHVGSRAFDAFDRDAHMSDDELDKYLDFQEQYEKQPYPKGAARHHLLGHSSNIQGDMQLEAQLVSHGLNCGHATAYSDPRRAELEQGADDWLLLLQLDSDSSVEMMWGDVGRLYFWIRSEDLAARRFDRVWMSLQCY